MLRHPGARRLITTLGLPVRLGLAGLPDWLGDGSLSLTAQVAAAPGRVTINSFDLTAAALCANGKVALSLDANQPRLTGAISITTLPMPDPSGASDAPLPLAILRGWQAELHIEVGNLFTNYQPVLRDAAASLTLANGVLHIDQFVGKLGSGMLSGGGVFDSMAEPPALHLQAKLNDASIDGPLDDAPIDLLSGHITGRLEVGGTGFSPSAIVATLTGQMTAAVTNGVLTGFDLFRVKRAAANADRAAAGEAMGSGVTDFERLDLDATVAHGDLALTTGSLSATAGTADITGHLGLLSQAIDLRVVMHPAVTDPPEIALRLSGSIDHPNRTLELSGLSRWLAEHAP